MPLPEWIHLLPTGTFSGADGRGPWRVSNAAAVIAASMSANRIPVDENHATDLAAPLGQPSPARGWIYEMQARPDGIWGHVAWNGEGQAILSRGEYRSISPVFTHDYSGNVTRILRAALTNRTNLPQLTALNARQGASAMSDNLAFRVNPLSPSVARALGMSPDNHGGPDIQPTASEREIAAKMGLAPHHVAAARVARERAQALLDNDAGKIADFKSGVTAPNRGLLANSSTSGAVALAAEDDYAKPRARESEVARRMGADPAKLAKARTQREEAELQKWDGYINWGGRGDPSYQLTPLDQRMCDMLGVDPQAFLAWKRDPISAPRPRGLPADINRAG